MLIRKMKEHEIEFVRMQRLEGYKEYRSLVSEDHWYALKGTLSSDSDLNKGVEIFVAEIENQLAGSIVLFPGKMASYEWTSDSPDYPEIRMLAVDHQYRGHGIGRALVQHCIDLSAKQGYSFVGLHTADFMKNAIALYTKMNFERVPEFDFEPVNDGIIVKGFRLPIPLLHPLKNKSQIE
ncbi:GNAT family N-acetyltransferase [Peribacillus frigoritolerans]|uniref:GNAT family N-acetyltransferase n=1 Tax=Peribacillus frigoritolerans TaxID=450367 RepID=UPI0010592B56|nr:GNAT family N-acetyltransferase [Peribacillus frigoritolerans]TDL80429.1 GNAT family N-acetyltransferase [Peribacillus frigoritolerans]